jgi:hypothetical protein
VVGYAVRWKLAVLQVATSTQCNSRKYATKKAPNITTEKVGEKSAALFGCRVWIQKQSTAKEKNLERRNKDRIRLVFVLEKQERKVLTLSGLPIQIRKAHATSDENYCVPG